MRSARFLSAALLCAAIVAGCASARAGWTYMPAPSLTPPPASAAASGQPSAAANPNLVTISALNIAYEQTAVMAPAGKPFQIQFENKDAGTPHNVAIHQGSATGTEVFKGAVFPGVATQTYAVPALTAGTYAFVCTVHASMVGTLTVQ